MNFLKTYTLPTSEPTTFLVYWTNTNQRPKGLLKVCVNPQLEDRHIVAELAAMRHLLEDKAVVGNTLVGNHNTKLIVSLGAIRKLHRMQSDKAHLAPFAHFLTTRFAGCPISVDKDTRWFEDLPTATAEVLQVHAPQREKLPIPGYGEVSVTRHVLERIAQRFPSSAECAAQMAWKFLCAVTTDSSIREVARKQPAVACKRPTDGRYFLNRRHDLVLVVTDKPGEGKRLVTTYASNHTFHDLPIAA